LHLNLGIILRILLQKFDLEAIDPAVIVYMVEESFHAIRQRNTNRVGDRAGIRRENAQSNRLVGEIDPGAGFDATAAGRAAIAGAAGENQQRGNKGEDTSGQELFAYHA
jgi:hypothetical protein